MASDGDWGELAGHDSELAQVWDSFTRLPEVGANKVLDEFLERKGVSLAGLLRLGAKLSAPTVLAFAYPGGIKYRDMVTGKRWSYVGSEWLALKIIKAPVESDVVIVAEGETDSIKLSECYPSCDIAVLPAGAKYFPSHFADQILGYTQVLVGLDNDTAGHHGAALVAERIAHAQRFAPPEIYNDWCEVPCTEVPELPEAPTPPDPEEILVPLGRMLTMEVPEVNSYYDHALLPIGGFLMLHGWAKSFKTFLGLDLMAQLAQGQDWCCFEPQEEPVKVAVVQFEIPWAYYRSRTELLMKNAREPKALAENFLTLTPLIRPKIRAGDKGEEDKLLSILTGAGVQVLLLDPIRRATGSIDLNDEAEVRKMLGFFERLNNEGITVVATHHDNKTAGRSGGGDPLGMTGSGAWAGDPDTIVSVELPSGDKLASSTRRNLHFTLRNAPTIPPRGFDMQEDGHILYSSVPHGSGFDESEDEPQI